MGLEDLLILLGLIVANGVFSMAEIAIVSARKSRLEALAKKGDAKAKVALALGANQTKFLSTVQVGITLIGILTGAVGGSDLTTSAAEGLAALGVGPNVARPIALGGVVLIITYFSIVLGELVPKQLGLSNPEVVARAMAPFMRIVSKSFTPFSWVLTKTTDLIISLLKLNKQEEPSVTEEEIKELINQGTTSGEVDEVEQDIIERVFQLGDRKIGSIMTTQLDISWLDINDSFENIKLQVLSEKFSHFPVCDADLDKVVGILNTRKFLVACLAARGKAVDIRTLIEKPFFIPENMTAYSLLEQFKTNQARLAVVVDEYASVLGMVTMHDLIEELVGDIETPTTQEDAEIVKREDGTFLIDALLPFEEFLQHFEISEVDPEDRSGFHTLGGFILHLNEQIPRTGEIFVWKNFTFEIMDMDGNRIDKILLRISHEEELEQED